jgi:membrane protease YdiL (CAAX protease family)
MRDWIVRRSPRGEFLLVTFIGFALFIATSFNALLRGVRHLDLTTARIASGIAIELAILAATSWILRIRGWNFARLGLHFSPGAALAGLPLMLAYLLLYWFTALTIASFAPVQGRLDLVGVRWLAPLPLTIAYLVLNSVYEELLVAGYVITALERDGAAYAITASTLIRFLYHLYQGPVASLSILPMGLLFGTVYWRTRSLWPLMLAHTLINLLIVLAWGHQRA